jgi:hypothetical protein
MTTKNKKPNVDDLICKMHADLAWKDDVPTVQDILGGSVSESKPSKNVIQVDFTKKAKR